MGHGLHLVAKRKNLFREYFSIRYRVIRSLPFNLLISQFVGVNQQAMSAFQQELKVTVQTVLIH